MKKSPIHCKCTSCECGIYTYEETEICVACKTDQHLSGAKRIKSGDGTKEKSFQTT